jgi:hypothetical protein
LLLLAPCIATPSNPTGAAAASPDCCCCCGVARCAGLWCWCQWRLKDVSGSWHTGHSCCSASPQPPTPLLCTVGWQIKTKQGKAHVTQVQGAQASAFAV